MISTAYIHEHDFIESCMESYEENASDIRHIMNDFSIELSKRNDMKVLNIYTESNEEYFNESVTSAVTALGQKILDILAKLKEKITEFIDKITGKKKDINEIDKRIQKLAKEDPALAEKLKVKLAKSDFNIDTVKDLNEYYSEMDKLIEELKKENVDPKSIKGKFQKVKDKLEKNADAIKTASVILGIVATGTTIALNIRKLKGTCDDVIKESESIAARAAKEEATARQRVRFLEEKQQFNDPTAVTKLGMLAEMENHMASVTQRNVGGRSKLFNKLLSAAGAVSEKAASVIDSKKKDPNAHDVRRDKNLNSSLDKERGKLTNAANNRRTAVDMMNEIKSNSGVSK